MGYGIIKTEELSDIADAIRSKLGVQTTYKPSQMADAIESISGGGITPTGTKSITENGTYDVTLFASAEVSVPSSGITPTGTKQISITSNGTTTEDVTAYANAEVVVNVPTGITPTGTKHVSVTQNGTTTEDVTNYANVQINTTVVNQDYEDALTALGVQSDLADSIEALTTYANGITGQSDTDLSDAVHTLGAGYGGGSLPSVISDIKGGNFTLDADTQAPNHPVSHGLGAMPKGVMLWTDDELAETANTIRYCQSFYISSADLTAGSNTYVATLSSFIQNTNGNSSHLNGDFTSANVSSVMTDSTFKNNNSAIYYKAGVTYKWLAWK